MKTPVFEEREATLDDVLEELHNVKGYLPIILGLCVSIVIALMVFGGDDK